MNTVVRVSFKCFSLVVLAACSVVSQAAGMVPETSVVLVSAADGEGVINVKNTDKKVALLYTSLENVPEDQENFLVVTPPVARVEAGETQLVRFVIHAAEPITTQRLKRVTFEGIPHKEPNSSSVVGITVRQDLAVLVTPADLPPKSDPWALLTWSFEGQKLTVKNDSRYVVRLSQQLTLLQTNTHIAMPRPYILPGQTFDFDVPAATKLGADTVVRIYPASTYGFSVGPFDVALNQ